MRVHVELPVPAAPTGPWLEMCATTAEALGFAAVGLADHPAPPEAWLRSGGHPTVDPFVGLAVAAGVTEHIGLHTNVVVLGYRHPLLLARLVASLDASSDGRVVLGLGVGYLEAEFAALGATFSGRAQHADAAVETAIAAWTGEPLGEHRTVITPMPVQRPHPPLWFGGNSRAAMARAVRFGAAWTPMPSPSAATSLLDTPALDDHRQLAARVAELHRMAADAGRGEHLDVVGIPPAVSGFASRPFAAEEACDQIGRLTEAGVTVLTVAFATGDPGRWLDEATRFAQTVMPKL